MGKMIQTLQVRLCKCLSFKELREPAKNANSRHRSQSNKKYHFPCSVSYSSTDQVEANSYEGVTELANLTAAGWVAFGPEATATFCSTELGNLLPSLGTVGYKFHQHLPACPVVRDDGSFRPTTLEGYKSLSSALQAGGLTLQYNNIRRALLVQAKDPSNPLSCSHSG